MTGNRIYQHGNKGITGPWGGHSVTGALSRQPAFVVAGFRPQCYPFNKESLTRVEVPCDRETGVRRTDEKVRQHKSNKFWPVK